MAQTILNLKHWGNNLGVRLPSAVAREADLHADQQVMISVEGGKVIITPLKSSPSLSLAQRLVHFDPQRHGGEQMQTASRLGAEE